jgi:hypothetical protein
MKEMMQLIMNSLKKLAMCKSGDVVVDRVRCKDSKNALMTLKQFLKQRPQMLVKT